jgi:hypothetical protein
MSSTTRESLLAKAHPLRAGQHPPPSPRTPTALFYSQVALMAAYTLCAFLLPDEVETMSEATHIAAVHGVLSVLLAVLALLLTRSLAALGDVPAYFPISSTLADAPVYIVWMVNAILLVFLGVESWLRVELGDAFSVLALVQLLAAAELAVVLPPALRAGYRWIQYRKLAGGEGEALPTSDLAGGFGGGNGGGGNNAAAAAAASSLLASPFPIARAFSRTDLLLTTPGGAGGGSSRASFAGEDGLASPAGSSSSSSSANASAAPFTAQIGRLNDRIRVLERKEDHLLREMRAMAAELTKALSVAGGAGPSVGGAPASSSTATPSSSDLGGLLRAALDDVTRVTEEGRKSVQRIAELEDRSAYLESELRRAAGDVQKLRGALKDERKKTDKLYATLDLEREANAQAQGAINDLRQRVVAAGGSVAGVGVGAAASAALFLNTSSASTTAGGGGGGGGGGVAGSYSSAPIPINSPAPNRMGSFSAQGGGGALSRSPGGLGSGFLYGGGGGAASAAAQAQAVAAAAAAAAAATPARSLRSSHAAGPMATIVDDD